MLTGDSFTNVRLRRFSMESKKEQLITEVVYRGNHTWECLWAGWALLWHLVSEGVE